MRATAAVAAPVAELRAAFEDEVAFRGWYEATLPRVYAFLASRCGGPGPLAEELTQQTFVEAVRRRQSFDGRSDVVTWLCAIARHKLADHFRRLEREERRRLRMVSEAGPAGDQATGPWQGAERRDAIESALARLPAAQRAALVFRYLDGLSIREVAMELERSESATESLLARARQSFERSYEEVGDGD
jgi:RNA polymerase sigma-70 factor (ECF subfamily)